MSPTTAVWIASSVGALLFFVAGALSARARSGRALRPSAVPAPQGPAESTLLEQRVATLQEELQRARASREELEEEVERLRDADARVMAERNQGRRHVMQLSSATRDLEALRSERDRLERERDDLAHRLSLAERRLGDAEAVASECAELRQRLTEAERVASAAEELRGIEEERKELAIEVEMLRERVSEIAQLREENARLKRSDEEREILSGTIAELRGELAALRAQGLARARRPSAPPAPAGGPRATEGALQSLLSGIAAAPGMRSAALGDGLGLPIAGIGEHAGPLAAFAAFMDSIADKARDFLPMDGLRRIAVEDEHGATVSAFPLSLRDSRIVLVTLTVGSPPPTGQMTELVRSAATVVQ